MTRPAVRRWRRDNLEVMRKHQIDLEKGDEVGNSIIRGLSIHSETSYTVEQNISCCVVKKNGGWAAIIWLDSGKDLSSGPQFPWKDGHQPPDSCLPVIQYYRKAALRSEDQARVSGSDLSMKDVSSHNSTQSGKLLPFQYGSLLDPSVMRKDAMYDLSGVFAFAACSESQFVNFMSGRVEAALRGSETQQALSLSDLRFSKSLLDEHITYLQDVIMFFKNSADGKWPSSNSAHATNTRGELLGDFECLLRRVRDLAVRCLDGTAIIMNDAMLEESRRAIVQAGKVEQLTTLAFFFVPFTLTCSVFGMNFREFGQGEVRLYVFGYTACPILIVSAIFCFWSNIWDWFR